MPTPITVPRLGWSMDEGVFTEWLAAVGQFVRKGDRLFVLESDKAAEEIESLDEGVLWLADDSPAPGAAVRVGQVIGFLLGHDESPPCDPLGSATPPAAATAAPIVGAAATAVDSQVATSETPRAAATIEARSTASRATPRARRRAAALGVDWRSVAGTGRGGRVRERDIVVAADSEARSTRSPAAADTPRIRRLIAERMRASCQETAPVTLTTRADVTELRQLREATRRATGDAPTWTELLIPPIVAALRIHPRLNARWEDERVVELAEIHLGVAVDTPRGLVVPVLRHADRCSPLEIAGRLRPLIAAARDGRLAADELRGGTFTITNLGAFGIDAFTPIIQLPEAAVLGLGAVRQEVVPNDEGHIAVRSLITLSLTFDHRVCDGAPAAAFLQQLVRRLEGGE